MLSINEQKMPRFRGAQQIFEDRTAINRSLQDRASIHRSLIMFFFQDDLDSSRLPPVRCRSIVSQTHFLRERSLFLRNENLTLERKKLEYACTQKQKRERLFNSRAYDKTVRILGSRKSNQKLKFYKKMIRLLNFNDNPNTYRQRGIPSTRKRNVLLKHVFFCKGLSKSLGKKNKNEL